jgi:hypothetical protein
LRGFFIKMTIDKYLERLKSVIDNLPTQLENVVKSNAEQIADLNREQQLYFKGEDANGKKLLPYTNFTKQIKRVKRQPFDRTTLNDTGDFFNAFEVDYQKASYLVRIYSTDDKTPKLMAKYGKDIFGLQPINHKYLDEQIIKKHIDKWILSKL